MGNVIRLLACAKINLTLEVTGLRGDGYHLLRGVMQSVSLCDRVTVEARPADDGISVTLSGPFGEGLSDGADNTAHKAARVFFCDCGITGGARIHIEKHIPLQAGLGGGSADAAVVLHALNELYDRPYDTESLTQLGAAVGADVPFCTAGGTCLVQGVGERLTFLPPMPDCFIVLAKDAEGAFTPQVYRLYDTMGLPEGPGPDSDALLSALLKKDFAGIAAGLCNALEPAAIRLCPSIPDIKALLMSNGAAGALTCGSGAAVFGLFASRESAQRAYDAAVSRGLFAALCRPAPAGVLQAQ